MDVQMRRPGGLRMVAGGAAAAFVAGLLAFAAPASAGGQIVQSASATAFCDGGEGGIDVEIFDNFSTDVRRLHLSGRRGGGLGAQRHRHR